MATVPTLEDLILATISDLEAALSVTIPDDDKNYLRIQSAVQAARLKLLYLNQAKLQKNIFADTAEYESQGGTLERFGRVKLGRSPQPALAGQYTVTFTGTPGTVVPARTLFNSDDDSLNPGFRFVLDSAYTLGDPDPDIRALTAGVESQLEVGNTLSLVSPIALVDTTVTVTVEPIPPQNAEDLEEYREKTLEAYRLEPQGGAGSDYRLWAADAQGVEQSYPFSTEVVTVQGPQIQVNLFIEATEAANPGGNGVPTPAILDAVEDAIEDPTVTRPSRKPLTALVNYLPVTPLPVDVEIVNLQNTSLALEQSIQQQIKDFGSTVRPFVGSIDTLSAKNDIISEFNLIGQILQVSPGAVFDEVILTVDGLVVSTFTFSNGNIPYISSVIFT